jgi:ubiquinone/menaquinone biosynthesis C-methylase UbiE
MFQQRHALLPEQTHDEAAREAFCSSLRKLFTMELWPGCRQVYRQHLEARFKEVNDREPETLREVTSLMNESFYFRSVGLLGRTAQEMLWDTVGESIERQIDTLNERAKPRDTDIGTVRTNPDLPIPRYVDAVDIHVMPGNFHTELSPDDTFAGALYDRGVHVFAYGGLGPRNDAYGDVIVELLKETYPDFKPRRILDVGCGIGSVTLPLAKAFPDAEVYGVDIGGPTIRYAHGRAESLGLRVHYSQQDMTAMDFEDGQFDLVVSMLVTHECPVPTLRAMFAEAHRVLAPGGVMMHDGVFSRPERSPIDQLLVSWFGSNANEPFAAGFHTLNFSKAFEEAGFSAETFFTHSRPPVYLKGQLPNINFIGAVK